MYIVKKPKNNEFTDKSTEWNLKLISYMFSNKYSINSKHYIRINQNKAKKYCIV